MFKKKYIQYDIVQCDPMPIQCELEAYYKDQYYQGGNGSYDVVYTEEEISHKIYESKLIIQSVSNFINLDNISNSRFVELGCGEGFLLNEANKTGFQVLGVDHSEFGITKWNSNLRNNFLQKNIYIFLKEAAAHKEFFDVCCIKNVLEHVVDPTFLLNEIKKVLNPGGKIIVTVPNDYSKVQNKLLGFGYTKEEDWFCPPDHLYYFNIQNFPNFVNDLGFDVLDVYSSFPVDVFLFNKHSNYVFDNTKGKDAHFARIKLDLLIGDQGLDKALRLYRSMAECGIGRNFTSILRTK